MGIGSQYKIKGAKLKDTKLNNFSLAMRRKQVMNMHNNFDGFSINLILDEDGDWLAHFLALPNISAFGEEPEEAIAELKVAWSAYIESCRKHGDPVPVAPIKKEYSGQFNVRLDKRVHRKLAVEAARAGISLNALVAQKLAQDTYNDRAVG
jgi:predicted HicB family RNase H-like nuclease